MAGPIVVATSPASARQVAASAAASVARDNTLTDPSNRLWTFANLAAAVVIFAVLWWRGWLRPRSISTGGTRHVDSQPAFIWAGGAALVFFSSVLAAGAAAQLSGVPTGLYFGSPKALAIVQLSSYGCALLSVFFLLRLLKDAAPKAGLTITTRSLTLGLFAGVLAWPILTTIGTAALWVQTAITHTPPDPLGHPLLKVLRDSPDSVWAWALGACAVVGAPIVEETLYRGFLQSFVLRVTGLPWVSVLCSSAVFAMMHYDPDGGIPWAALVEIGVFGLILGYMFERTKRLGVTIAMHILFNAGNLALAMLAS
ncbi:MAG: CPBP family intramembrane metalloprotease [Tepidisphaera sp.]|nr:CPBP family intramembrane metalloprotease [Tepidisphaera sp.]